MIRRSLRTALVAAALVISSAAAQTASAQVTYSSCTPGVCGWMEASLVGTVLSLKVQNRDHSVGSALYRASITFANAFSGQTSVSPIVTASVGASTYGGATLGAGTGWSIDNFYSAPNTLDLASFYNVYIEGSAPTTYGAEYGAYVTPGAAGQTYIQFTANLSGFNGIAGNSISALGFETDISPAPVVTPEPASVVLLATGLFAIGAAARRRRAGL